MTTAQAPAERRKPHTIEGATDVNKATELSEATDLNAATGWNQVPDATSRAARRVSSKHAAFLIASIALLASLAACRDLIINAPDSLIPVGTPFVLSGTAEVIDDDGPCLVWLGENGIVYHLFQKPTLESDLFDKITSPGVTSRLEVQERTDIDVACQQGPVLEVQDVLEVIE
jgi:hypothetical protein